jgi:hypothetical protein
MRLDEGGTQTRTSVCATGDCNDMVVDPDEAPT